MWPFGGDKGKKGAMRRPTDMERVPTGRVIALSSRGMSEPEIIKTLKGEGYTPLQVDQAMKEALKTSVASGPAGPPEPPPQEELPGDYPQESGMGPPRREMRPEDVPAIPTIPTEDDLPPPPEPLPGPPEPPRFRGLDMPGPDDAGMNEEPLPGEEPIPRLREPVTRKEAKEDRRRALEELAESIIEEKWVGIREEIMNLKSQAQETNLKVASLEQSIKHIEGEKRTDMEQIEEKIDTYKQSIGEVSSRMESIEKAMKDSLSPMMQSMRSLTDTIRSMKEKGE